MYYVVYIILVSVTISLYFIFRVKDVSLILDAVIILSIVAFLQWQFKTPKEQSISHSFMPSISSEGSKNQTSPESLADADIEETSATKKVNILIFQVSTPLAHLSDFYGRKAEYRTLLNRIKKGASTSIVGEQKSGKTWFLTYTFLKARSEFDSGGIKMGYMNAAESSLKTVSGFTNEALRVLNFSSTFTSPGDRSLAFLDAYIRDLVEEGQTPVLFIDNFEAFTKQEEFNSRFFEALRAMTQVGLALVVASRQSLIRIVSRSTNRSPFFNVFAQIKLSSFDLNEAQEFVHSKAIQAGFTDQEQDDMLHYGQDSSGRWPPLRLQLVGNMLLEKKDRNRLDYEYDVLKNSREFEKQIEKEYSMLSAQ